MLHLPHVHTSAFTLTSCEGDASTQDENELTKLTIAGSGRLDLAPDFGNERRERVVPLTEQCTMCGVVCAWGELRLCEHGDDVWTYTTST